MTCASDGKDQQLVREMVLGDWNCMALVAPLIAGNVVNHGLETTSAQLG